MKAVRKKLLVIAVALVLSLSLGMTFAYFSDYTTAKGGAALTLGGSIEITEPKVTDTGKEIVINNTGETDVLLRVKVIGPDGTKVEPAAASDWFEDTDTGYWYYTKPLAKGASASKINASFSGDELAVSKFDVLVVSDCVQVTYDYVDGKNVVSIPEGWNQDFLN